MALSDEEQRLLAQLEKSLADDDPQLAHLMRGTRPRPQRNPKHVVAGVLGFVIGLTLLVLGMQTHWSVSVVGFVIMAASAAIGLGLLTSGRGAESPTADERAKATAKSGAGKKTAAGGSGRTPSAGPSPSGRGSTGRGTSTEGSGSSMMDRFEERWRKRQDEGR